MYPPRFASNTHIQVAQRIFEYLFIMIAPLLTCFVIYITFYENDLLTESGQINLIDSGWVHLFLGLSGMLHFLLALPFDRPWRTQIMSKIVVWRLVFFRCLIVGFGAFAYCAGLSGMFAKF